MTSRAAVGLAAAGICLSGCDTPRRAVKYPQGALPVRYQEATSYSTCLVASVAMGANYLLGGHRYSENGILRAIKQKGLDQTRVGDLKTYLAGEGLHLVTLRNCRLAGKPPTGLRWWLEKRGHPVICIINRDPAANPDFQHAVLVIGISANPEAGSTDIIYYFDPSSAEPLHATEAEVFELLWARCDHAMMVVVAPPAGARLQEDQPE